ncbi:a disintegrin and metalloproteinase with thrombospondin motifs 18 [Caerostris extrusa]|uniref:A disintegrin and metalloproteinase with thrombospondin motifs 18 n=1 Tax=Caerostris extrusa TaxID=172846 RepID=A0AAV4NHX5_CAEEX|nr:a disintegrin and metalloproteinase with thrombospondin motifs 18 [Caerostris extrusa]
MHRRIPGRWSTAANQSGSPKPKTFRVMDICAFVYKENRNYLENAAYQDFANNCTKNQLIFFLFPSLGMEHDGHQDGNHCDSDTYVMSPTLGAGKLHGLLAASNIWTSSLDPLKPAACRHRVLTQQTFWSLLQKKLPGQVYDADYQCTLRYGDGSRRSNLQSSEEICRMLRCDTGYGSKGVSLPLIQLWKAPVAGEIKGHVRPHAEICRDAEGRNRGRRLECVVLLQPLHLRLRLQGSAQAVGIMVATRRCDNPRPQNGGRFCVGKDRRVLTCDATRICSLSTRKLMLDEFISDTCRQASSLGTIHWR